MTKAPSIELLRSTSGLSIDEEGQFRVRGESITHRRTLEVLWNSLERQADGRYLIHIGRESGYVNVLDCPYLVRGVDFDASPPVLSLSDGSTEFLRPETLYVGDDGRVRCWVKPLRGEHRAAFSRSAQVELGLRLEPSGTDESTYQLTLGGLRYSLSKGN